MIIEEQIVAMRAAVEIGEVPLDEYIRIVRAHVSAKQEVELRATLRWYAEPHRYEAKPPGPIVLIDGGALARAALADSTATVILTPTLAAEAVCHDEQMVVWANDFVASLGDWLREDIDYSDLQEAVKTELRRIILAAFDHPEAKTVLRHEHGL